MNKKGFTLVELLAVVVILGIMMGVGIPAVSRQLERSREESFNDLRLGSCDALLNYILQENKICQGVNALSDVEKKDPIKNPCAVQLKTLVSEGYLDSLRHPGDKHKTCDGEKFVYVYEVKEDSEAAADKYIAKVELDCGKYTTIGNDSEECSNLTARNFH